MGKDDRLIAKVAWLYYNDGLTQQEIADRLRISRQLTGRVLKAARELGFVEIRVYPPSPLYLELEQALEEKYGLNEAVIVPSEAQDAESIKEIIGQAGARYLSEHIKDDMVVGISWGTTLEKVANQLIPENRQNVKIVQLNGGMALGARYTNSAAILSAFSNAFNAQSFFLNAPAVVDSVEICRALYSSSAISKVLELANDADIYVYSVGALNMMSVLVEAGYFTDQDVERLRSNGAVGDICSVYIDANGKIVDPDLLNRTIGIDIRTLPTKKTSIAIAGGPAKVNSIHGALVGRYCNVLITDEITARELLHWSPEIGKK